MGPDRLATGNGPGATEARAAVNVAVDLYDVEAGRFRF